jgi:hypothetical protein
LLFDRNTGVSIVSTYLIWAVDGYRQSDCRCREGDKGEDELHFCRAVDPLVWSTLFLCVGRKRENRYEGKGSIYSGRSGPLLLLHHASRDGPHIAIMIPHVRDVVEATGENDYGNLSISDCGSTHRCCRNILNSSSSPTWEKVGQKLKAELSGSG